MTLLPLPKPKPDLALGNSQSAFNRNQPATIDLVIDKFGTSYAKPDSYLRFPFLDVEFKSQAKNGTLCVATSQVAGAGPIAMNGNLELMSLSFGLDSFDFDEQQFFPVIMDHKTAYVNVYWIRNQADIQQNSFQLEELSTHLLSNAEIVRALRRAIKNILEYGSNIRL